MYGPRRDVSFPVLGGNRRHSEDIGGGPDFVGGSGGGRNLRDEESLESGGRLWRDIEAQRGRRGCRSNMWVKVLLGMLMVVVCLLAGFLGMWIAVLAKYRGGWCVPVV